MNSVKPETREKILKVAADLFSKFGFNGTSVRDIATECDVNIAAINYHFGSKHNLYWAVAIESREWANEGIRAIAERVDNIEDMVTQVYDFLMSDQAGVRTAVRIMMTDGVPEPDAEVQAAIEAKSGPPGTESFFRVLKKQIGQDISDKALYFGVKSLFGSVFHLAMIFSCTRGDIKNDRKNAMQFLDPHTHLCHQARAVCEYLVAHPNL